MSTDSVPARGDLLAVRPPAYRDRGASTGSHSERKAGPGRDVVER